MNRLIPLVVLFLFTLSLNSFAEYIPPTEFLQLIDDVFPLQVSKSSLLFPKSCAVQSWMKFNNNKVDGFSIRVQNINANTDHVTRQSEIHITSAEAIEKSERITKLATYKIYKVKSETQSIPKTVVVCTTKDVDAGSVLLINEDGPILCAYSLNGRPLDNYSCIIGHDPEISR